jgi:hypothetical protein
VSVEVEAVAVGKNVRRRREEKREKETKRDENKTQ